VSAALFLIWEERMNETMKYLKKKQRTERMKEGGTETSLAHVMNIDEN